MTPVIINGRQLGVATNGVFTSANTDPIPGGHLWPAAAATWNAMRQAYIAAGGRPEDFMPAGPNSSARSRGAQDYFWTHQPPPAAPPYTSNHGWAIAVDVKTRAAAAWIMRHGPKYGWSHDEGARVGEWWHFRYVGLSAAAYKRATRKPDPLAHLTRQERRWCRQFDRLRGDHSQRAVERKEALRRRMALQALRIRDTARQSRGGWDRRHRRKRWRSLRARCV